MALPVQVAFVIASFTQTHTQTCRARLPRTHRKYVCQWIGRYVLCVLHGVLHAHSNPATASIAVSEVIGLHMRTLIGAGSKQTSNNVTCARQVIFGTSARGCLQGRRRVTTTHAPRSRVFQRNTHTKESDNTAQKVFTVAPNLDQNPAQTEPGSWRWREHKRRSHSFL